MNFECISYEKSQGIATIKLNRPKVLNAMNKQLWLDFQAALADAGNDPEIKVLVVTGQDPLVVELARPYLHQISGCVLAVLFFSVLRNFVAALSRPNAVMVITVGAVVVNYALTIWFVHGSEPTVCLS